VRCPRCGNENSDQNRFCGMCGATLLAASAAPPAQPQPVTASTSAAAAPELAATRTEPPRPSREASPSISGPSFLGLSDAPPGHLASRKRARLSIDPHGSPGSNLDYLLSDEEQPRHWGPGKILLLLIALALALGFGYLRWKTHGFAWLNPPAKKPDAAATQNPPSDNNSAQPAPSTSTPEAQPPASQPSIVPAPDSSASNGSAPTANPPTSTTPANNAPKTADAAIPANNDADNTPSPDKDSSAPKEAVATAHPAKPAASPKPTPRPTIPKPSPVRPAADPVIEAQRYLYGKGVPQDCERGMRLLKPAANQSNAKAMMEMGALYSAGLCTPHDLPTAYRWFALALRRDPENTAIQTDLSKLWGEMTPPERQLAIKLTQ
jgi:hypothetical protein